MRIIAFFFTLLSVFFKDLHSSHYPLESMTLEEKVGQLLMVHFYGEEVNEEIKTLIETVHIGGVIYYAWANGLSSPKQVLNLSLGLQELACKTSPGIPLFIAVDQEGGLVARLTQGFTVFPGNKALGMTFDPTLAERSAFIIGQELRSVGVNFNLSPVVDINSNSRNPIIGIRSFGDSKEVVVSFAKSTLSGYKKAGIITSLKHFPGHGDVLIDSHHDLPVVRKSKGELEEIEFFPFRELAGQADTIMTAHVMLPAIDPVHCTTLSKKVVGLLREEMNFQGLIVSDSLTMDGLLKNSSSIDEAAVSALNAGCDLILFGGKQLVSSGLDFGLRVEDMQRIHQRLIQAVRSGEISMERLDEAVLRILKLKEQHQLIPTDQTQEQLMDVLKLKESQQLSQEIAEKAIQIRSKHSPHPSQARLGLQELATSFPNARIAIFAPRIIQTAIEKVFAAPLGLEQEYFFFQTLSPLQEEIYSAQSLAKAKDVLLFFSCNAWRNPSQAALIHSLLEMDRPCILVVLGDPLDGTLFQGASFTLTTFSPSTPSIRAAVQKLRHGLTLER